MAPSLLERTVLTRPFLISLYLAIGGFLYGFDSGITTPVLVQPNFVKYFHHPSSAVTGAVVSVYQAGGFFGGLLSGLVGNRLGRRKTVLLGCVLGVIGAGFMAGSAHLGMLLVGRAFEGGCVATITSASPIFSAEISKKAERARTNGLTQFFVAMGFFTAFWTGYGFKFVENAGSWRICFALTAIPAIILGAGVMFIPESPRWLCLKGREEEAEMSLRWYRHKDDPDAVTAEFIEIRDSVRADLIYMKNGTSWYTILTTKSLLRRLFLGTFVWTATIISGLSFVQYYQPFIYRALKFNADTQLLVTGLYGCLSPICVLIALTFVEKVGRVPLLAITSYGYCTAFAVIAALSASYPPTAEHVNVVAQRFSVACVFSVSVFHSLFSGPVSWVYPPEVFTVQMRAKAHGVAQASGYLFSTLLTEVSPIALEHIGWKYYVIFAVVNFLCALVFTFFYPETKGKSLEEINQIFGDDARDELGVMHPPTPERVKELNSHDLEKYGDEDSKENGDDVGSVESGRRDVA
ncbi:general substrate transporter [Atractiella rhizophila]|nr:general substrate transporter [Atractiella rhizophila]